MSGQWNGGKGDLQRPVNSVKWENAWKNFCRNRPCRFRNGRCIYCGGFRDKDSSIKKT